MVNIIHVSYNNLKYTCVCDFFIIISGREYYSYSYVNSVFFLCGSVSKCVAGDGAFLKRFV
jgi:hypothetical protein